MKKWFILFTWILTWRAEWDVLKFCSGYFDEVRGVNTELSERLNCKETVFNWRSKQFNTWEELVEFRDDDLESSPGTTVTDVSWFEVKESTK